MTSTFNTDLTESEAAGIQHFEKPGPTWTEAYGLDKGMVSLRDCWDPEFFELEREAVFRRSWLYMGRVEELPRAGSFFTRERPFLNLSALIAKGMDNKVRAFHNVCAHRGNKLMWEDTAEKEMSGMCRQFACKYHGWRYALDGGVNYVHNAPEFFDLTDENTRLREINCEVWAGFIFINLQEKPAQSLREFLGEDVCKLESYPFDKMTHTYVIEGEVGSNWKLLMDAFQELYHVPYVHSKMNAPGVPATGTDKVPFMMPMFKVFGKHRCYTSGGPYANRGVRGPRPLDRAFQSTFYGPERWADVGDLGDGINPGKVPNWGLDSWQIYPNLDILMWNPNWYLTYEYWPIDANRHRFIWTLFFAPPRDARDRLSQEHTVLSVHEFAAQDVGAVEAMQAALKSGAIEEFHFNDQEVLARHLHRVLQADVDAYVAEKAAEAGTGAK